MTAVPAEGFSIREYAWRMRSVDVGKCWPFDDVTDQNRMKASLPPITVKKFTWWFKVLQLENSDNKILKKTKKKKTKKQPARDEGLLQHKRGEMEESDKSIDGLQRLVTKKDKIPKKRSIVELFAVAPQVDTVDDDADDDDNGNKGFASDTDREDGCTISKLLVAKNVNLGSKGKKIEKKKIKENLKNPKKGIEKYKKKDKNKKRIIESGFMDFKIAKKERSYKRGVHSTANLAAYLNSPSCNKELQKDNLDGISTLKKKARVKHSTVEKKMKDIRIPKSLSKCQNAEVSVRGILKNHTDVLPIQSTTSSTLPDSGQGNPCCIHQANKHVAFSVKDDLLRPIREVPPAVRSDAACSTDHSSKHVSFSVKDDILGPIGEVPPAVKCDDVAFQDSAQETRESLDTVNTNGKSIFRNTRNDVEAQPAFGGKICVTCHAAARRNFQKQPSRDQEDLFHRCVTAHSDALQRKELPLLDRIFQADPHDRVHANSPDVYLNDPIMLENSSSASSIWGELGDLSGNHSPRNTEVCYRDFMKIHTQPSYLSNRNPNEVQEPLFPSSSITRSYSDLKHYPVSNFSPKHLMPTIFSVPEWNEADTMDGDISMDEQFVGLPLNSQGELIKLNSRGKRRVDQLRRPSNFVGPSMNLALPTKFFSCRSKLSDNSSWDVSTPPEEHLQILPPQNHVNEKPYIVLPHGCIGDYRCTRKTNTGLIPLNERGRSIYPVVSELDHMIMPHHHYRLNDQVWKHTDNMQIKQHGNPQNVSLHVTQSTMRLMGKEFTVGKRDLRPFEGGDVWNDKQIIAEHPPGNNVMNRSQAFSGYIGHPSSFKPREAIACSPGININEGSESFPQMKIPESSGSVPHLICQTDIVCQDVFGSVRESPAASRSLYNFIFQEPVKLGCKISNPQSPSFSRDDLSKSVSSSYNNLPHATKSGFSIPLLHSLSESYSGSSRLQSISGTPDPFMSDSREKRPFIGDSPSFPDLGRIHYADVQASGTFHSYDSFQNVSAVQNPVGIDVLSHLPSTSLISRSTVNLSTQSRHRERFGFIGRTNSNGILILPDPCKSTNKRHATFSQNSMKPNKIPNLEFEKTYNCLSKGAIEDHVYNEGYVRCKDKATELGASSEPANPIQRDRVEVNERKFKVSSGLDCCQLSSSTSGGPVKLTAGTRHILKPCQNAGQNTSMPIRSTIRFVEATVDKVSQSEKSAKIYKF